MTYDEIERIIGKDVCDQVAAAIERAYIAASLSSNAHGIAALHELIVAQLASVIAPEKDQRSAESCLTILRDAVQSAIAQSTTRA